MEESFWRQRWAEGRIGFHREQANPLLTRHWRQAAPAPGTAVLVPLCGKSVDMPWLLAAGHPVTGIELAGEAIEAFERESAPGGRWEQRDGHTVFCAPGLTIWVADLFALAREQLGEHGGLYDRAALIALPPPMRERYAAHLGQLLDPDARGLLITLEYLQALREGPPFAVMDDEVTRLYRDWGSVEPLERVPVVEKSVPSADCAWALSRAGD